MTIRHVFRSALLAVACSVAAHAGILFQGVFSQDDDVVLKQFIVSAAQDITIDTTSYANGGFDPMLSLFDSTGLLIGLNNDGGGSVTADPVTGNHWDAFLFLPSLAPDTYTLAITQSDNGPLGPTLADGFLESGNGNFSGGFVDLSGSQRQPNWSVEVIGDVAQPTPEPSAWMLVAGGSVLLAIAGMRRVGP